ncbi:FAD-dependent oxidoreductase [Sphingosinicella ginsenosidimutans]|uniref:FAD-dependent oxidoreductase n=1 Tax=Allosphingosinicella ginsenosidimutans TaxID=1176539 RepID=A0A5C6TUT8_9SPHN|nr:FAD-dependent oxidoreductase [Sphingosinicella ginsenosidimutans]TXC64046.1 FAD-dependent oxidoreductase [Sphingosinicella ginsenosidimutans]
MASEFDVVVIGTGAAGMTAAIAAHENGASVAIFEKHEKVGGTSAWSGGQVWIPNNPHMADLGLTDSSERATGYIMSLSHDLISRDLVEAYVEAGPEMVRLLEERTPVEFYAVEGMPDYHPEFPGGNPGGGRTIECPIYSFAELGDWADRVTPSPYYPNPHITMSETPLGRAVPQPPSVEEVEHRRDTNARGCGQALIGRLLRGLLDRGIEPVTSAAATELTLEGGRVVGVKFEIDGREEIVRARRGVILACGGFEWDRSLVRAFLRGPMTHPVSIPTNQGDGLRMAMKAGAMLGNMREAWWVPVADVPASENPMERMMIAGQRTLPRSIMVNQKGRRFTNEAANYNAFGAAFHEQDVAHFRYANLPCWLVFDQGYVDRFGFGRWAPPGVVPDWVMRAPTLAGLADKLAIPAGALEATVARWNDLVAAGADTDFGRGESAFDRWWGDPNAKGKKEATLGPLETGPFYALPVNSGVLGTKGGPQVDVNGQVVDIDGDTIPGLYAAGNVMASPFGMTYGGPGGTLGPAMVFGFLSGRHAAMHGHNQAMQAAAAA